MTANECPEHDDGVGVILVCDGASSSVSLRKTYEALVAEVERDVPHAVCSLAIPGQSAPRLRLGDGSEVLSLAQAYQSLRKSGLSRCIFVPLLLTRDERYERIRAELGSLRLPGPYVLGRPIVSSTNDARTFATLLIRTFPQLRGALTVFLCPGPGMTGYVRILARELSAQGRQDMMIQALGEDPARLVWRIAQEAPLVSGVRLIPMAWTFGQLEYQSALDVEAALERSLYRVEVHEAGLLAYPGLRRRVVELIDQAARRGQ